jgi:hypothetical protein
VSDQTNAGDAGDFRGSAADKRKDETVMVNADDLSNLVSSARQDPVEPVPPAAPAAAPAPTPGSGSGKQVVIVAGVLGVIAVIVVIILLVNLASG